MAETFQDQPLDKEASGLTKKQDDMSRSFSPLNFQQQNQPKEKQQTQVNASNVAKVASEQEQAEKVLKKPTEAEAIQKLQIDAVAAKVGNFGYALKSQVNKFLNTSTAKVGVDATKMEVDPLTGKITIPEGTESNVAGIQAEKEAQQKMLKGTLSPFATDIAGKLYAKSFEDVLEEQIGNDPQVQASLGLLKAYDASKLENASPAERAALQHQLEQADKSGLVSGLLKARKDYESLLGGSGKEGMKFYGDAGDEGYSAFDMAGLSKEKLKSEIEKAQTLSSGLFGGDFESSLRKSLDAESAKIQASKTSNVQMKNKLQDAFASYLEAQGTSLQQKQDEYTKHFEELGNDIAADLAASGDTAAARVWLEAAGNGKVQDLIKTALDDPNSGIDIKQRNMLKGFLNEIKGDDGWLEQLVETGSFEVPKMDKNGNPVYDATGVQVYDKVTPDAPDQMRIMQIMQNPAYATEADKKDALNKYVEKMYTSGGANLKEYFTGLQKAVTSGADIDTVVKGFHDSFIESMKSYAGSETEELVERYLVDGGFIDKASWDKMDETQRDAAIIDVFTKNPAVAKGLESSLSTKLEAHRQELASYYQTTKDNLTKQKAKVETLLDKNSPGSLYKQDEKLNAAMPKLYDDMYHKTVSLFDYGYKKPGEEASELGKYFAILNTHPKIADMAKKYNLDPAKTAELTDNVARFSFMHDAYLRAVSVDPSVASFFNKNSSYIAMDPAELLASGNLKAMQNAAVNSDAAMKLWLQDDGAYLLKRRTVQQQEYDAGLTDGAGDPVIDYYKEVQQNRNKVAENIKQAEQERDNIDLNIKALDGLNTQLTKTVLSKPVDVLKAAVSSAKGDSKSIDMSDKYDRKAGWDVEEKAGLISVPETDRSIQFKDPSQTKFKSFVPEAIVTPPVQPQTVVTQEKVAEGGAPTPVSNETVNEIVKRVMEGVMNMGRSSGIGSYQPGANDADMINPSEGSIMPGARPPTTTVGGEPTISEASPQMPPYAGQRYTPGTKMFG